MTEPLTPGPDARSHPPTPPGPKDPFTWARAVEAADSRYLRAILSELTPIAMEPEKFILAPSPHMRRAAEQQLNDIVSLLRRVTGGHVAVELASGAGGASSAADAPESRASTTAPSAPPMPAPPPRQDIMNQHPLVKLAGEVLGARVIRVEPRPPSQAP